MTDANQSMVGKRVLIDGRHPWSGCAGEVVREEMWLGRPSVVVRLDNGIEAGCRTHELTLLIREDVR